MDIKDARLDQTQQTQSISGISKLVGDVNAKQNDESVAFIIGAADCWVLLL